MIKSKSLPTWEISAADSYGSVKFIVFDAQRNTYLSPSITLVNVNGDKFTNLDNVPAGIYQTSISKYGYFTNTMTINVIGGKT